MYLDHTGYFGMHFVWWIFWLILWGSFFSFLTPVKRSHMKKLREMPLDILHRRLASGEITVQEYENTKSILERNTRSEPSQLNSVKSGQNQPLHN